MNKQQIGEHPVWKYIYSLNPKQRYGVLLVDSKASVERNLGVIIENRPYTYLPEVREDQLAIAVTDPFSNTSSIAVLTPNSPLCQEI